jgi:hypothetical protein
MVSVTTEMENLSINIDYQSISQTRDIFINQDREVWIQLCNNFINTGPGVSARELINFLNSRHLESTYKYNGIDFDDLQRSIPVILRNLDKINRISSTYDWHNVCHNLNKCAYLCFLWTLWPYKERDSKIKQIYLAAKNRNSWAQHILDIPDTCTYDDWSTIMNRRESGWCSSPVHRVFTDISKIIQYPKKLSDIEKAYAQQVMASKINGLFTCQEIHTITCYAYNFKLKGRLYTSDGNLETKGYFKGSTIYEYRDSCWFNPPKPSDRKIHLCGFFENHKQD